MRGPDLIRSARAQRLRRDAVPAERKLWARLRDRRLGGLKFVRQEPIGAYVADFVCRAEKLVVEVDGATHSTDEEIAADALRTANLERAGFRVLRVLNAEVYSNLDGVLETILAAVRREG